MSERFMDADGFTVTSYCGPLLVGGANRMRVQIDARMTRDSITMSYDEVRGLVAKLAAWLDQYGRGR